MEDFTSFWERGGIEGGHVMLIDFATVCHNVTVRHGLLPVAFHIHVQMFQ